VLANALRALPAYPRRNPVTAGYVLVLVLTHVWVSDVLSGGTAHRVLLSVSTNLDNLQDDPVGALIGSALFFDGTLNDVEFLGPLITVGLGVVCGLAWLERRHGARRAFGIFLTGHVMATLITAQVIAFALMRGWYPQSIRHTLDFGVSYGTEAVFAAVTFALPRRARPFWVVFVLGWPFAGSEWDGPLPDFTTIGHLTAAAIGFTIAAGAMLLAKRRNRTQPALALPAGNAPAPGYTAAGAVVAEAPHSARTRRTVSANFNGWENRYP
jgi:hypothetical protein